MSVLGRSELERYLREGVFVDETWCEDNLRGAGYDLRIAGNIAVKFRNSMDGILVLGGFLVDPGYRGRLHFQLANIGREPFEIDPEKTSVAALQLLRVDGDPDLAHHPAPRTEPMLAAMFNSEMKDERLGPLAFFTLRSQVRRLEKRLSKGREEIKVMKRNSTALIIFGLFVIFAAIIGTTVATILST